MTQTFDAGSTAGQRLSLRERAQLLVVGAGTAGCAAAIEGARRGLSVVLVGEHPVDPGCMGLDVPFHFGGRTAGAGRNTGQMIERLVAAQPAIGEAFEAGVDVRLGVAVWGLFTPRPGIAWIRARAAGLTDGASSWFCGFDAAILATGHRDAGVAFPGWTLPGVMGVTGAHHLLRFYEALDCRRVVVLGSDADAVAFAEAAGAAGRTVAAVVEAADRPLDAQGCERLAAAGVAILTGSMIRRATGRDGVESVDVVHLGGTGTETAIACDTVVLATGGVPVVELFDVAGARLVFAPERGGHVPAIGLEGHTSVAMLFAAGDCTGVTAERTRDSAIAARDGVRAAGAAADALAAGPGGVWSMPPETAPASAVGGLASGRLAWARAALAVADADTPICQCEEVSIPDLLGVRPPRYLERDQPALLARDLASLAAEGGLNQDQIKRLTRAGMGVCQGRRCREQIGAVVAAATGVPLGTIALPSYRAPVRPLPLAAFADADEATAIADHWEVWFGIESQWVPFWETLPDPVEESAR